MRTSAYLLFIGGLALFTFLIGYHGLADVVAALAVAGWGLIWVTLFHLVPLIVDAVAWRYLFLDGNRPSLRIMVWARWIGESINGLLPVARVGGDLAKARLIMHRGVPGPISGASVVAEITVGVVMQIVFTLIGVGLLLHVGDREVVTVVLIGLCIMVLLVAGFCLAQRLGMFGGLVRVLTRFGGHRDWQFLVGGAAALDDAIWCIYRNRGSLLAASFWKLCGWIVGAGEVWLALYFLGSPVSATNALLLESLGQAVRAAAFLIPGGLGVQEGGFLVLGGLLGLGPEVSLALSLTKRVRELLLGLPGLIVWQIAEGRRLWRGRRKVLRELISKPMD